MRIHGAAQTPWVSFQLSRISALPRALVATPRMGCEGCG
jgi:hypothetical protein